MGRYNSKGIFARACSAFNKEDFVEAKNLITLLVNNEMYRDAAIDMLLRIDLKLGKLKEMREKLDVTYKDENLIGIKNVKAQLENEEYNYDSALKIYDEILELDDTRSNCIIEKAGVFAKLGEYDKAREELYEALKRENVEYYARIDLAYLLIYKGEYEKALESLKKINKVKIPKLLMRLYEKAKILCLYHMGKDVRSFNISENCKYMCDILLDKEDVFLSHASKHKIPNANNTNIIFLPTVNLKELKEEIKDLISKINPSFVRDVNGYKFIMDKPVGICGDTLVNGLAVYTVVNTDKIMSMYPEDFSSEFDKEGYRANEELKKKLILR